MVRPVETQQASRKVKHGAIGALDGWDSTVATVRFPALVAKPEGIASVLLELKVGFYLYE